jgi:hypothetical protein
MLLLMLLLLMMMRRTRKIVFGWKAIYGGDEFN